MAKKKTTEPVMVAILDKDMVYQGTKSISKSELTEKHIQLPNGCDLPAGKYHWNTGNNAFMPIKKGGK